MIDSDSTPIPPTPSTPDATIGGAPRFDPSHIERPDKVLLKYYVMVSLMSGPLFPLVFLPMYFKYVTLKYKFDETGVSMSWGILFRREIHLTYRRIQDIHLNRNVVQRWMGLATLGIQTASGSATPEMSIEGIIEAEPLRDYLYAKMRGARGEHEELSDSPGAEVAQPNDEVYELLTQIRDSMLVLSGESPATASAAEASPPLDSSEIPPMTDGEQPGGPTS